MSTTTILIILVVAFFAWKWVQGEYEFRQKLQWYANRMQPIVEISQTENDEFVEVRAAFHREMLKRAGNRWGIPVYSFPYPNLKLTSGKYLDFYVDYKIECGRFAEEVRNQFNFNLNTMDKNAFTQYVAGQRPAMQDLNSFENAKN